MIIPESGSNIQYKYISSFINLNITLDVADIGLGCKLLILDVPFKGKFYAIVYESEGVISLIKYGKGLFYGKITPGDVEKPIFEVNKNQVYNEGMTVRDKYIVKVFPEQYNFTIEDVNHNNCSVLAFNHENGYYYIYFKDGEGILAVQNYFNNVIRETIYRR